MHLALPAAVAVLGVAACKVLEGRQVLQCLCYLMKGSPEGVLAAYASCCAPKKRLRVQSSYAILWLKNLHDCAKSTTGT
jgi:hypothetical protein